MWEHCNINLAFGPLLTCLGCGIDSGMVGGGGGGGGGGQGVRITRDTRTKN